MNRQITNQTQQQKQTATPSAGGLLQRKCACGNHTMAGGDCEECCNKKGLGLQTKLTVNEPGDIYEQEADRIADQVMAMPANSKINDAPPRIQRLVGESSGQLDTVPASVDPALASPGRPLEPALRQDMEQRFRYDFSQVRVHTGLAAEQSARDLNAHAYTVGHDIVFGIGRFEPGSQAGSRLIAHELTHVVQQSRFYEWAWIQPSTDPAAHALSATLPEVERQHIRVITSLISLELTNYLYLFQPGTIVPLPDLVTVNYAGTFPELLRNGLRNVAGRLLQRMILPLNSTVTLALHLEHCGGDFSAFRFTYIEHTPSGGQTSREVLIEHLGSIGIEGLTLSQHQSQEVRFRQHRFSRGRNWSEQEFESLLQAIAQIPDNLLTPVDQLTFNRAAADPRNHEAGGDYNPSNHTITMYNRAFEDSPIRFGTPGPGREEYPALPFVALPMKLVTLLICAPCGRHGSTWRIEKRFSGLPFKVLRLWANRANTVSPLPSKAVGMSYRPKLLKQSKP